ncbi:VanW family protein [Clostridium sp. Marseille-Q7071]
MNTNLENNTVVKSRTSKKKKKAKAKKRRVIIISLIAALLMISIGGVFYVKTTVDNYESVIYPGMKIQGIDLSGKTKEEALKLIEEKYKKSVEQKKLIMTAGDKSYVVNYADMKLNFNLEDTVKSVFEEGKDKGVMEKFKMIKNPTEKDHQLKFTYDNKIIENKIKTMESELNKNKVNAKIAKAGDGFDITPEQTGMKLDSKSLQEEITKAIASSKETEAEVKVKAKLVEDKPTITKAELEKINTKISDFSTSYENSTQARAVNIEISTNTINGTLLMPGDSVSFNTIVGDTTPDKGYLEGVVIIGDKFEKDYGGGVCQVSTTLHNAVLRAGILPDSRLNHNLPVGYVEKGLDAAIAYGWLDYVFTNNTKYPMYIEGYAGNSSVGFNIYSNSALLTGKRYEFYSETYATTPFETKVEEDSTLEEGTEVIQQYGMEGYKVKAYRVIYQNDVEISRELMNNDTYAPTPQIVKRGTKKAEAAKPSKPDENKDKEKDKEKEKEKDKNKPN